MISEKVSIWLKFLGGFLGWFAVNTLALAIFNLPYARRFFFIGWIAILLFNFTMLTIFTTLKGTRLVALGIVSALALNFVVAIFIGSVINAICFVPVTYPDLWRIVESLDQRDVPGGINRTPIGSHEGNLGKVTAGQCKALGWAVDPDNRTIDLKIRVLVDGKVLITGVADKYRPEHDVPERCPGGTCGYEIDSWDPVTANTIHAIRLQAQDLQTGQWHDLSNTPKVIECSLYE